jgi:hypothetical protein
MEPLAASQAKTGTYPSCSDHSPKLFEGPQLAERDRIQPLHSAVVGEGACSLLLTHHLQADIA